MGVVKAWNFFKGYVIIKVKGLTLERFLNLAATNDIYLWDIRRIDYTELEMKATIEGFRALKEIVNKVGCRVEIVEKKGLPFLLYRIKNRKALGIGFILFFIIIIFLSSIIWDIDIVGNEKVKNEDILKFLETEGIKSGIIKYKVDKDYIEYLLLNKFENFSFVSVEIKGTKLIIELKEIELLNEEIDENTPSHIIAAKKGVIEKVIARNGKAVVRKGDIVEKDDILISGIISNEGSEGFMLVHADGEVWAKTLYSYKIEEPIIKTVKEETGRIFERKEIKIGDRGIQFIKGDIPFDDYVESTEEVNILNLNINFPIKILVHKYKEVETKEIEQDVDLVKEKNHIKAVEELNKQIPQKADIISKDVKHFVKDNIVTTYVAIEVIEDISKKRPIN
ncbi:MAG: sporulation protein YqfD [Tissierellia bacterium]|nr:sporulation protein YqfD [Tissierellia bacterium]